MITAGMGRRIMSFQILENPPLKQVNDTGQSLKLLSSQKMRHQVMKNSTCKNQSQA